MHTTQPHLVDWDPRSEQVLADQTAACDHMRETCPVARSDFLGWSVFRHADVVRVLHAPQTFSNTVSRHLSVPNGMDPPDHTDFRKLIDRYFTPERMAAFEPTCRRITRTLLAALSGRQHVELIAAFAESFAVQIQCAFLGWPRHMHEPLRRWTRRNQAATLAQDRDALSEIAHELAGYVEDLVAEWSHNLAERDDVMSDLMRQQVRGRPLGNEELTSILRNWTVGEVGTITASVGILAHFLAHHPSLQDELRQRSERIPEAIEEILRIRGPLLANRRITTQPVELGGRVIDEGERVTIIWVAANRDPRVFPEPDTFRWNRDHTKNLLYGQGIHACPGAPLARLQMRIVLEELLNHADPLAPDSDTSPEPATYPANGFAAMPLRMHWR